MVSYAYGHQQTGGSDKIVLGRYKSFGGGMKNFNTHCRINSLTVLTSLLLIKILQFASTGKINTKVNARC